MNQISIGQIMAEILCQDTENLNEEDKNKYDILTNNFNDLSDEFRHHICQSIEKYLIEQVGEDLINKEEDILYSEEVFKNGN